MSARHVAQYWFLHALNSSVPTLRHFLLSQHAHPQELFREMSRLGGALCTFGLEVHPRSLPVYDHLKLGDCFRALDEHIRRHLEIVMPSKAIRIPLTAVRASSTRAKLKTNAASAPPDGSWKSVSHRRSRLDRARTPTGESLLLAVCRGAGQACVARPGAQPPARAAR